MSILSIILLIVIVWSVARKLAKSDTAAIVDQSATNFLIESSGLTKQKIEDNKAIVALCKE